LIEHVLKFVRERRLLQPGDRVAIAVSAGADSVALLRAMLELREELGVVLSVAHFHHGIRGAEADADRQFVAELAAKFGLELHSGSSDAPTYSRERKLSLETAARELRHAWFAQLVRDEKVDKIATAHTLDDQAETVLMRILRGAGAKGLAGIAPWQAEKHLIRPLLEISRKEVEAYLHSLGQIWREDATNKDLVHTRNRVRHQLLPLLEKEFNPNIRHTLADLAEVARGEADYWGSLLPGVLTRVVHEGKPSRSGRSSSGNASETLALDLSALRQLPVALQRQIVQRTAEKLGATLDFKHIAAILDLVASGKPGKPLGLPSRLEAAITFRELHIRPKPAKEAAADYQYLLTIPGEVQVAELGTTFRASVIARSALTGRVLTDGETTVSRYNPDQLLDRALLAPGLTVRNWLAGDRYCPAHTGSPKKVKELLQSGRVGHTLTQAERRTWPVLESAGQIVWLKGFPVPEAFAHHVGDAVLIEEVRMTADHTNFAPPTEAKQQ
jgi:tRNA(Ile)-lysidine synthase